MSRSYSLDMSSEGSVVLLSVRFHWVPPAVDEFWCSVLDLWYPYLDGWYELDFTSACKAGWVSDFLWVLCTRSFAWVVCWPRPWLTGRQLLFSGLWCVSEGFGALRAQNPWLLLCVCLCESCFGSWGISLYTFSLTIYSFNTFLVVL